MKLCAKSRNKNERSTYMKLCTKSAMANRRRIYNANVGSMTAMSRVKLYEDCDTKSTQRHDLTMNKLEVSNYGQKIVWIRV